jgi:alkylation response protein AidB-like acyl-CoA dehydrogenase
VDFDFTGEHRRFRQEVREFFRDEPWGELNPECGSPHSPSLYRRVAEKGWLGLQFPEAYGGQGKDAVYELIFEEEAGYCGAPIGLYATSVLQLGHLIYKFGTEQQKKEYLPRIINGEITAGQGFTEPEAGSDLASIQTRAVRQGDHYLVNGQKMFMSFARVSDGYLTLMARTAPDASLEKGISLFILSNKTPGMSLSPIKIMDGSDNNQLFLDDVKIPVENLIGEENRGWDYFMRTKSYYWVKDRIMILAGQRRIFDELVGYVKSTESNGQLLSDKPAVRRKIAEAAVDFEAIRLLSYHRASLLSKGVDDLAFTAKFRIIADNVNLRFANGATQILGLAGQIEAGSSYTPLSGAAGMSYLVNSIWHFIDGGTNTARNYVASHELGLPDFFGERP